MGLLLFEAKIVFLGTHHCNPFSPVNAGKDRRLRLPENHSEGGTDDRVAGWSVEYIKEFEMTEEHQTGSAAEEAASGYLAYDSPTDIMRDDTLETEEKRKLLESWKMDLDSRLYAESEGMSSSDPISASKEASLADQEQLVGQALEMLDKGKS